MRAKRRGLDASSGNDDGGGSRCAYYPAAAKIVTSAVPLTPSARAALFDRSMTRPRTNGPRSLIRTTTDRPLCLLTTRTRVPNGRVRCAAVNALALNISPLAVRRPWKPGPYQDAIPESAFAPETVFADAGAPAQAIVITAAKAASLLRMNFPYFEVVERRRD